MSEPLSEKNNGATPEEPEAAKGTETDGVENAPDTQQSAPKRDAPWTSEIPQNAGPAPVIELDGPVDAGSVKPLGPRRLARLQREMAEHAREVQEAEKVNAGEVDPDLLMKQQRFAELALRAAAANEQDRKDAQAALQASENPEQAGGGAPHGQDQGEETITVNFPRSSSVGSSLAANPLSEDPAQFPSSPVPSGSSAHTVSISVAPNAGETSVAPEPESARDAASSEADRGAGVDAEPETRPDRGTEPGPEPETSSGSDGGTDAEPEAGPGVETPSASDPAGTPEKTDAPGAPVRAVDAEGLELLEPKDYKQRSGATVSILVLLLLVLAALIAVVIIFVL